MFFDSLFQAHPSILRHREQAAQQNLRPRRQHVEARAALAEVDDVLQDEHGQSVDRLDGHRRRSIRVATMGAHPLDTLSYARLCIRTNVWNIKAPPKM